MFPRSSALVAGALAKFCFGRMVHLQILIIFIIGVLMFVAYRSRAKESFWIGYVFGLGYFGSTLYWIAESFECVGLEQYGYVAVALLVLYLSVFPALVCFLSRALATTPRNFAIFFPAIWVAMEYIRGFLFTGFPWNLVGYAVSDIPYLPQIADTVGAYGVSLVVVFIVASLHSARTAIYGIASLTAVLLYGFYKQELYDGYITPLQPCLVRIVQPSIALMDKMDPRKLQPNIKKQVELSGISTSFYKGRTLVVWPEAAIVVPLNANPRILEFFGTILTEKEVYLITGNDTIDKQRNIYNSAVVLGPGGCIEKVYNKRHLLPFGEFIPEFLVSLGIKKVTPGLMNFTHGRTSRTVHMKDFEKFNITICYEIAFPGEILDDQWSTWILNITNDSWFKNSDGPTQHLRSARFRAIEEGRAIVRCANNGISCVIDCNGKVLQLLETDEVGHIDTTMPQKWHRTIFSRMKNAPVLLFIALIIAYAFIIRRFGSALNHRT
ncbi:MAG: apolipoprotein N-acyltransferase [Holosporales bacterium]|jgi:apolipoprotein N-acyltransferase|nr:apolipoprotein N-acyltransferase [Holosporales bacterium]